MTAGKDVFCIRPWTEEKPGEIGMDMKNKSKLGIYRESTARNVRKTEDEEEEEEDRNNEGMDPT